jgi:hypothetical protein
MLGNTPIGKNGKRAVIKSLSAREFPPFGA